MIVENLIEQFYPGLAKASSCPYRLLVLSDAPPRRT